MTNQRNLVEIVEIQSAVISIQAGVIKDLFSLLSQYMTAEELDSLPEVARINHSVDLAAVI